MILTESIFPKPWFSSSLMNLKM